MGAKSETRGASRLNVVTDSVGCSNTIGAPHEYFYQTRTPRAEMASISTGLARSPLTGGGASV
jgi:hypothetical protein